MTHACGRTLFALSLSCLVAFAAWSAGKQVDTDWPQWRGPDRDGRSNESGLALEWPGGQPRGRKVRQRLAQRLVLGAEQRHVPPPGLLISW